MFMLAEAGVDQTLQIVLTPPMLSIIPMLAVVLQVVKGIPFIQKHTAWFPVVAIAIAVFVAVATKMGVTTADQIIAGITMGLATAGGYDVAKMTTKAQKVS